MKVYVDIHEYGADPVLGVDMSSAPGGSIFLGDCVDVASISTNEGGVEVEKTVKDVMSWSGNVNHGCLSMLEALNDIERRMESTDWGPQHEYRRKAVRAKLEDVKLAVRKMSHSLNLLDDELREIK